MNKSNKLVRGIGDKGLEYSTKEDGIPKKEYRLWGSMLERCTEKYWSNAPAYVGTTCSNGFKSYTFFYEWCQKQVGFGNKDDNGRSWCLDKDILVKGNKVYSEDTCAFVPNRINTLIIKRDASRGEFPIGVHWHSRFDKYAASCRDWRSTKWHLGYFNTPQEAFLAYKTFKEVLIKQVANEYKEMLDSRVYEALMNYEVNEND